MDTSLIKVYEVFPSLIKQQEVFISLIKFLSSCHCPNAKNTLKTILACAVRPCVCRRFSDFRLSRYFGLFGLSDFETSPVYLPWFRMSENFAKLTENFPENRNIRNMLKLSKMIEIFGLFRIFRKSGRPSYTFCQNTYIPKMHSKPS